eukprot:2115051-Rhodomonas_salina.1
MLRLLNSHLREGGLTAGYNGDGSEGGEGCASEHAAVWSGLVTWLTDKVLSLGREAHEGRKVESGEGRKLWRVKAEAAGEACAALI